MASFSIIIVSDATGETAVQMVGAALVQFEKAPARIIRRPQVTTAAEVRAVVKEAAERKALVLHTLVSAELRRLMLRQCRLRNVDAMDLMGPVLERLSVHLGISPKERPGLFNNRAEGKTRQIDAVGFAFRHDDGQGTGDLHRAEIVLVGPSRTMKTPVMLYLAYRGWFCGNTPLVLAAPRTAANSQGQGIRPGHERNRADAAAKRPLKAGPFPVRAL
jgi:regulator of PEP synthase PpsR (kinase-PPPase family)